MMVRVRQFLVVVALTGSTLYLLAAFAEWSIDPANWGVGMRIVVALTWVVWAGKTLDNLWSAE